MYGLCLSDAPYKQSVVIILNRAAYLWLVLEGMQLAIQKKHGLGVVLVGVRESVIALCEVEAKHHQGERADELLLEGNLSELRSLHCA